MIYVTADHHMGHKRIAEYTGRDFPTVGAMDAALIAAWNDTVGPSDTIYHLGDFTLGGQDVAAKYFRRLNGHIKVVPGGHDHRWVKQQYAATPAGYISGSSVPVVVLAPLHTLKAEGHIIVLCHYAMRVFDRSHYGSYHLYGHSHGRLATVEHCLDVGVDNAYNLTGSYGPFSLDDAVKIASAYTTTL